MPAIETMSPVTASVSWFWRSVIGSSVEKTAMPRATPRFGT